MKTHLVQRDNSHKIKQIAFKRKPPAQGRHSHAKSGNFLAVTFDMERGHTLDSTVYKSKGNCNQYYIREQQSGLNVYSNSRKILKILKMLPIKNGGRRETLLFPVIFKTPSWLMK